MNKNILVLMVFFSALAAQAQPISCRIDTLVVGTDGMLMPKTGKRVTTVIQSIEKADNALCTPFNDVQTNIKFCAQDGEFIGGYTVAAVIESKQKEEFPSVTSAVLATSKKNAKLIEVGGLTEVSADVQTKLFNAKIDFPNELHSDSAMLDEATQAGFKAGILKAGELVTVRISDCRLENK